MPTFQKTKVGYNAHSESPACHRLVRLVSRPRVFLLGSRQPCQGTSSCAIGMSSSSPTDSDVEEAVESDTVAVGSNPAAVTGETCTRDQHPTSWEDAVDRWAKGQGEALKPCKASQWRGKCCFRSQDVKAPWCYTRAGARCKVVTVSFHGKILTEAVRGSRRATRLGHGRCRALPQGEPHSVTSRRFNVIDPAHAYG
jgi:hypothetical protein